MGQSSSTSRDGHRRFGGGDWVEQGRGRELSEVNEMMDWYSSLQSPEGPPAVSRHQPSALDVDGHERGRGGPAGDGAAASPESSLSPHSPRAEEPLSERLSTAADNLLTADHPWIFLAWLGISLAILTLGIGLGISGLSQLRSGICSSSGNFWACYAIWILFAVIFSMLALASTTYISVHASGSGIPECKVILSDVILNRYLSMRTLIGKIIGLMAGFAGTLSIGKEGPYVHIAAMVANQWMRIRPFKSMSVSDTKRMQMLSAACAVGVASAFGAPVGGVLFSIEVTNTYYLVQNMWHAFFAAVVASTTLRLLVGNYFAEPVSLFITEFEALPYSNGELVVFVIMGAVIGLLALAFIRMTRRFAKLRKKLTHPFWSKPAVQVLVIALASALIRWPWSIMRFDQPMLIATLFKDEPLPVDPSDALSVPGLVALNLALFVGIKMVLTALTITLPIPAGLFMPVFAIGAAFGRMVGEAMAFSFPAAGIHAAGYAVVGAAAMASGVTRTVSTAVIIFEVTGQVRHMLPVLLAVVVANAVCGLFSISIYDQLLRLLDLPHNVSAPSIFKRARVFTSKTAKEIMRPVDRFRFITPDYTCTDVIDVLMSSRNFVFPVVDSETHMLLLGQVQRGALEKLIEDAQRLSEMAEAARQSSGGGAGSVSAASPFTAEKSLSLYTARTSAAVIGRRMRALSTASAGERPCLDEGGDVDSATDVDLAGAVARAAFVDADESSNAAGIPVPPVDGQRSTSAAAGPSRGRVGSIAGAGVGAAGDDTAASADSNGNAAILAVLPPRSNSLPHRSQLIVGPAADGGSAAEQRARLPPRTASTAAAVPVHILPPPAASTASLKEQLLPPSASELLSHRIPLRFGPSGDEYVNEDEEEATEAGHGDDMEAGHAALHSDYELRHVPVDPAPFSIWERTPVAKIHFLFTMLKVNQAFVTRPGGVLSGIISKREFYAKHKNDIMWEEGH